VAFPRSNLRLPGCSGKPVFHFADVGAHQAELILPMQSPLAFLRWRKNFGEAQPRRTEMGRTPPREDSGTTLFSIETIKSC